MTEEETTPEFSVWANLFAPLVGPRETIPRFDFGPNAQPIDEVHYVVHEDGITDIWWTFLPDEEI